MKFTHFTCYLALSGAYTAGSLGFDKTAISVVTAVFYLLMAIEELRH